MTTKQTDWEAIERAYRAGSLFIKSPAGCSGIYGNDHEVNSEFARRDCDHELAN